MSTSNFSAKIDELHMMKDAADRRRLEEEKEKDLGTLLENLPDVISRYDRDLRYVYVSPAIEKITGLPPQAFIGKTDRELKMPEDLCDTWQRTLERVFKIGMPEDVDFAYPSSRGLQYFESRLTPEFAGDGQVQYVLAVSRDVTRSRKAEAALKESEARYREIVEDQTEMICRFRPDGVLTFVNEAYCRYFHHGRDELIGRSFQPLIHEDDRELVANLLVSLSPSNPVIIIENRIILPDGAVRWNRWTDRAIYDREGSLQEIQAIGWDITEQKLAQTALKESRRRLADIFDFLPDATFVIDRAGKVIACNRAIERMTDIKAEEMLGQGNYEYSILFHGERRPILIDLVDRDDQKAEGQYVSFKREGDSVYSEGFAPQLFGKERFLWAKASPLYDCEGRRVGAVESVRDITERWRAEQALRESEAMLARAQQIGRMGSLCWQKGTDYVVFSEELSRIFGLEGRSQNITIQRFLEFIHPDDREKTAASTEKMLQGQGSPSFEYRILRSDGGVRHISAINEIVSDESGNPVQLTGVLKDVTDQKMMDELLRAAQAQYQTLVEQIPAITYTAALDEASTTLYISPPVEALLGITPDEYRADPDMWRKLIHTEDLPRVMEELSRSRAVDRPFVAEYRMISRDGRAVWFRDEAKVVKDESGRPVCLQGIMLDITERKRAERESLLKERQQRDGG